MPLEIGADFVAVDEIQLCADPERGHVFTDRLLRARGLHETLFLGSETMRGAIAALVPRRAASCKRDRFSTLTYTGSKKISRMPPRSRHRRVFGRKCLCHRRTDPPPEGRLRGGDGRAVSPRTRNAQVALYQNGDVDYLVATDAIGMGLNLDIQHVAFSATAKFDGRRMRALYPQEIGQIAGRAGRHTDDGTFGVTGEARPFDDELVEAIENHRFAPVKKLHWRNERAGFRHAGAADRAAWRRRPTNDWLTRARDADDLLALKALSEMPEVRDRLSEPAGGAAAVGCLPDSRFPLDLGRRNMPRCWPASSASWPDGRAGVPTDWLATQHRADRPDRRRHRRPVANGWPISAPGPTSRSARAGSTTKAIGATRRAL